MSGTSPGTPGPGGITVPLNFDGLTLLMTTQFNSGVFVDTMGYLDHLGRGASQIVVPPGLISTGLIGLQMDFAHLIFSGDNPLVLVRASNATRVTIVP